MPGLTGTDVALRVKQQFGDEVGAQITDAMILNWINDGQNEIVSRTDELFQMKSTASTTVGDNDYSLPTIAADIIRMHRVYYKGKEVKPLSIQQAEESYPEKDVTPVPTGQPRHYWIWADQLFLYPAPDATGAHLTLYWQKYPTPLAAIGDALTLPQRYHLKVKDYCVAQAAELDDDDERHNSKMAMLHSDLDMMQKDSYQPNQDLYPFGTVSSEDASYGY
jgi:hypothetical protein